MKRFVGVGVGILNHHLFSLLRLGAKSTALIKNRTHHPFSVLMGLEVQV